MKEIEKYIPKKKKKTLTTNDFEKIANGTEYGLMETMVLSTVDTESPWAEQIRKGNIKIKKNCPCT